MPGFGLDSSIFERLELPTENIILLDWITPLKNESIQEYASRLITVEMKSSNHLVLIGHSFGGLVMQEIGRILNPEEIILISSITSKEELSKGLRLVRNLNLHVWVHRSTVKGTFWMWRKGAGLHGEMKPKFKSSLNTLENRYFSWAVKQLANWSQLHPNDLKPHLILGDDDGVFSIKNAHNPIIIEDGDHMMVFKKPKDVSNAIQKLLTR